MTWKEFKERIEELGVTDDMGILFIDIDDQEVDDIHVQRTPNNQEFSIS